MSEVLNLPRDRSPYLQAERVPYLRRSSASDRARLQKARFEDVAEASGTCCPSLGHVLGVLLAVGCPNPGSEPQVLRPLWAEEAMHRAHTVVRLAGTSRRYGGKAAPMPVADSIEHALALDLARQIKSLTTTHDCQLVPCSPVLRDIVAGLGALFSAAAGKINVVTNIERMSLLPYKRRALVLAGHELVANALLHAFHGRSFGQIEVGLTRLSRTQARLRVNDDGVGFTKGRPDLRCGIAATLADLLEADLAYYRSNGLTTAEIVFPISDLASNRNRPKYSASSADLPMSGNWGRR